MCKKLFLLISFILLLGLSAETVAADPNSDPNLVGFWRFGDGTGLTAVDSSVYLRDGTLTNMAGTTEWVAGKAGGALDFDGTDDYVRIADYNGVLGNNPRTTMFWLKAPASVGGFPDGDWFRAVLGWGTYTTSQKWNINLNYGWVFVSTQGGWAKAGAKFVADDTWHHVAVVLPDMVNAKVGNMQIYIDGVAASMEYWSGTNVIDTNDFNPNSNVYIGQYAEATPDDDGKKLFLGMIDEVRIYDRDLSAGEILLAMRYGLEGVAWKPSPVDFATGVDRNVTLSWTPGDYAVSHDVYFGIDETAVTDANTSSSEYMGNQGPNTYTPGPLTLYETYYWRVDEINVSDANSPWTGSVWRFTVSDFINIDNFESYVDTSYGDPNLLGTWTAGGGAVGYLQLRSGINGGDQSMEINYDTTVSTASRAPDTIDWTADDVGAMLLWFAGDQAPNSEIAELFMELEDNVGTIAKLTYSGVNGVPDVNAILNPNWTRWIVDLQDFVDANNNLDLTNITRFTVGAENSIGYGGIFHVDAIRLKLAHCYAWDPAWGGSNWPGGDLNGDCAINFEDLGILVDNWLGTGITPVP